MNFFNKQIYSFFIILLLTGITSCGGGGGGSAAGNTPLTEQQIVEQDSANILITYATGNNISNVTDNITLPDTGNNGSNITWSSDNESVLSSSGDVTRPPFGSGNQTVTLTATLIKGNSTVKKTFIFTILETPPTDAQAVAQAESALTIGYSGSDNSSNVTQNLILGLTGLNSTNITWSSNNTSYITDNGIVTQPAFNTGHKTVVITATIKKNSTSNTKEFTLTVKETPPTDSEAVAQVMSALTIGYSATDNSSSITLDLNLITSGSYDTTITWTTDNSTYITATGNVNKPSFITGNQTIKLTATISRNGYSDTKEFSNLIVIKNPITNAEAITLDTASLTIGYNLPDTASSSVTTNLTLQTSGSNGTNISWATSNPAFIDTSGNVTRPILPASNQTVTLTATISKEGEISQTKTFSNLTVTARPLSDLESVNQAKTALTIGYSSGDSSVNVTQNLTLTGSGSNGTNITWATSNSSYVTNLGAVTRPPYLTSNTSITLTATITKGSESQTKDFLLTVIANTRFKNNGDGTIIDYKTGLLWERQQDTSSLYWIESYKKTLIYSNAGYIDWRLPAEQELLDLVADRGALAARDYLTNIGFSINMGNLYCTTWTSTVNKGYNLRFNLMESNVIGNMIMTLRVRNALLTSFSLTTPGSTVNINQISKKVYLVVPAGTDRSSLIANFSINGSSIVKGGIAQTSGITQNDFQSPVVYSITTYGGSSVDYTVYVSDKRFNDNGDGTITDFNTGIMWEKAFCGSYGTLGAATTWADDLVAFGYSDWHLPSVTEYSNLFSGNYYDWLNTQGFNISVAEVWTSTPNPNPSYGYAWGTYDAATHGFYPSVGCHYWAARK